MAMDEYIVQQYVAKHLAIDEEATLLQISIANNDNKRQVVEDYLEENGIDIANIEFGVHGSDIIARTPRIDGNRKRIFIEAKSDHNYYGIYAALGQLILNLTPPNPNLYYGLAFPATLKFKIQQYFGNGNNIKPAIVDLINRYTFDGEGLYFYFVDANFTVSRENWQDTLG